jgi:hypothetical protein
VHDAVLKGDWRTVARWLRDEEATRSLGHAPLFATFEETHLQHEALVGELKGRPESTGPLDALGNTILHSVFGGAMVRPPATANSLSPHCAPACPLTAMHCSQQDGRQLPPPEIVTHILRACPMVRRLPCSVPLQLGSYRQRRKTSKYN